MAALTPGLSIEQHLAFNASKGRWLQDGLNQLERHLSEAPYIAYPERQSLRKRIELVLRGTRAEPIIQSILNEYVPLKGDLDCFPLIVITSAITTSDDTSLLEVFKARILEHELGM